MESRESVQDGLMTSTVVLGIFFSERRATDDDSRELLTTTYFTYRALRSWAGGGHVDHVRKLEQCIDAGATSWELPPQSEIRDVGVYRAPQIE